MESGTFIQIVTATASHSVMIYALDDQGNGSAWRVASRGLASRSGS